MVIIIDLLLVALIAYSGYRGWRAGLIRGVCSFVALVASVCIANVVASAYSGEFTGMLKPFASGVVDKLVSDALSGASDEELSELENIVEIDSIEDLADIGLTDNLPLFEPGENAARDLAEYVLQRVGLSAPAAERTSTAIAEESEGITPGLTARITDRLCGVLAYIAVFIVCFLLLAIIFAVIGNLINFVFALPGLKLVDSITGAVFGVSKVLLLLFTLSIALRYFGVITAETVEKTTLLRYIVNVNPVANLLGI